MSVALLEDDVARFTADDPDELVQAALVCKHCLRLPDLVIVDRVARRTVARCPCATCAVTTVVGLPDEPARRLWRRPRVPRTYVHFTDAAR